VLFFYFKSDIEKSATKHFINNSVLREVDSIRTRIDMNFETLDMLKNSVVDYSPKNILSGIDGKYFAQYFTGVYSISPPVVEQVPKEKPATAAITPKTTPVVQKPRTIASYNIKVSLISWEHGNKYVIINDRVLREGESTSSGIRVAKIEKNQVLLTNKWSSQWVTLNY
jgi:rRNA-processing protein FCF1